MGDIHWGTMFLPLIFLAATIVVLGNLVRYLLDLRLPQSICTMCGHVGRPTTVTKGSFIIEVLLYFILIFPGIIYTVWRATSRYKACPACKNAAMIPVTTPRGQQLMAGK